MDLSLLFAQWPIVIALLGGLLSVKIGIIGTISQWFGLTKCVALTLPLRDGCTLEFSLEIALHSNASQSFGNVVTQE